ncbi:Actin-fragmin kinase (AFK) [Durusdinium trenchii]|uniref:Actin-fragmin kinase (AFK) n=1 Tax=Durusdinium trenchii TaxID=1381693 RepID=A0ABP0KZM4_9DINO
MPEDLPSARHGHSAILDTDRMWIFGGAGGNNGLNPSEDLLYYLDLSDLSDLRWIRVSTNTPSARFEHTAVVESGKMWIFGGHSGQRPSGALNDLHYLDLEGQSWAAVPARGDVPSPRYLHSAVSEARRMWIYGGRDETDLFEARNVFKRDLFVLLNNNGFYFNT